ncbi:expressed unknown protein [Seminavis robusta]|uniref:Uncharacterized protein n=1 Tax=Seminavis robusta TaxID=568900 RepID=A0A9N8E2F3_9STRA|nr:expressed unknown protein [Seminavis robusta]|eukprot:Sro437_g142910.1 n/a (465) ;mRNA; f:56546-57940
MTMMTACSVCYPLLLFLLALLNIPTCVVGSGDSLVTKLLRRLEDNGGGYNNGNYGYYYYDNEDGIYDLSLLYIKYLGCTSFRTSNANYGGNNDGGDNNNYYQYYEDGNLVYGYKNQLVRFTLCASSGCDSNDCVGEYAMDMLEFLEVYSEQMQQQQEQQCEYVKEHCYCSGGYTWESCLYNCYSNAGIVDCMDSYYGNEESFQLQEYLECRQAYGGQNGDNNNNNNNNNYNNNNGEIQFFVGPYCDTDSGDVFLGAFFDEYCAMEADASYFMSLNYGNGFPYFYDAIISTTSGNTGYCTACIDQEQQNNGDDDDGYPDANELCQMTTEEAEYKCDWARQYYTGCTFLNTTLPCLDGRYCPDDDGAGNIQQNLVDEEGGSVSSTESSENQLFAKVQSILDFEENPFLAGMVVVMSGILLFFLSGCLVWCCVPILPRAPVQNSKRTSLIDRHLSGRNDQIMRNRSK